MSMPALSIIMPTRNGADRLPATLARLASEITAAKVDAEVIVINDGSTDATADLLANIAKAMPSLRVVPGPSRGPGAARNLGVAIARASLIAFADDDDLWAQGRLQRQLAAHADMPNAVFSATDYRHVRTDAPQDVLPTAFTYWPRWQRFRRHDVIEVIDARGLIAAENAIGTSTVMVRRLAFLAVGGFDEALPSASDWDLWLRLAGVGPMLVLGTVGADYAMRAGSVSGNRAARIKAMETILRRQTRLPAWARRSARARLATARSEAEAGRGARLAAVRHALHAMYLEPGKQHLRRCIGLIRRSA